MKMLYFILYTHWLTHFTSFSFHLYHQPLHFDKIKRFYNEIHSNDASQHTRDEKKHALELLDCITSPFDPDDPKYDVEKDVRRDELLRTNDYQELKLELKERGLRTSGDKLEMIIRLLLHVVDPSIDEKKIAGKIPTVKYVDSDDIATNQVRLIPKDKRENISTVDDINIDAEDIQTIKQTNIYATNPKPSRLVMDGLSRREIEYPMHRVNSEPDSIPDIMNNLDSNVIRCYVVGGNDVIKSWEKSPTIILLCPDKLGWRGKSSRIIADFLAFSNQAIVVVPDLYLNDLIFDKPPISDSNKLSQSNRTIKQRIILDRIISTFYYCRKQYKPRTMSITGTATGASWALQAVGDIWDIATLSMHYYLKSQLKSLQQNNENRKEEEKSGEVLIGYAQRVSSGYVKYRRNNLLVSCIEHMKHKTVKKEASSNLVSNNSHTKHPESGINEQERSSNITDLFSSANVIEDAVESSYDTQNDFVFSHNNSRESLDIDSINPDLINSDSDSSESIMNRILNEIDDRHEVSRKDRNPGLQSETTTTSNIPDVDLVALESRLSGLSVDRAIERKLLRSDATLTIHDLVLLAPRAMVCFDADDTFADIALDELRCPSLFVFGESSNPASRLHARLRRRSHRIEDFCVRSYESVSSGFVSAPGSDADRRARQDALSVGGMWLDIYCRDMESDRLPGTGFVKYDQENGYFIITKKYIDNLSEAPVTISEYLHSDSNFQAIDFITGDDEAFPNKDITNVESLQDKISKIQ